MHATCVEIIARRGSCKIKDVGFSRLLTVNIGCRCCCRPFEHLLYTYPFPVLSLSRPRPILPEHTCTYVAHCGSPLVSIIYILFRIVWDRVEGILPPALHYYRVITLNSFVGDVPPLASNRLAYRLFARSRAFWRPDSRQEPDVHAALFSGLLHSPHQGEWNFRGAAVIRYGLRFRA